MRRRLFKPLALLFAALLNFAGSSVGQKPVVDSATTLQVGDWPSIESPFISHDGNYVCYTLTNIPATGAVTLVVQSTAGSWKRQFVGVECGMFSADGRRIVFKGPGDSLCIMVLGTDREEYLPHSGEFRLVERGSKEWLVYEKSEPAGELVMRSLGTGEERRYSGVKDYLFNSQGTVLVWREEAGKDISRRSVLHWEDLASGKGWPIWSGGVAKSYVFDTAGTQLAFLSEIWTGRQESRVLWYYKVNTRHAQLLADDNHAGIDSNLEIGAASPVFSRDGGRIFFQLIEKPIPQAGPEGMKVDVWNHKDIDLQSWQLLEGQVRKKYSVVMGVEEGCRVIRLQQENEEIILDHAHKDDQAIAYGVKAEEGWWNKAEFSTVYRVCTVDGSRQVIRRRLSYVPNSGEFSFSPGGHWILWFDRMAGAWNSYEVGKKISRNLLKGIVYPFYNENTTEYPTHQMLEPVGVGGWLDDDQSVLLYDDYDLWQVDPLGRIPPVNITEGYGRQHHTKFRITWPEGGEDRVLSPGDTLLLSAFDCVTKYNGFYRTVLSGYEYPERLFMGPYVLHIDGSQLAKYAMAKSSVLAKATDGRDWILTRRSAKEAPNVYTTRDFKSYRSLSLCEPQKDFNWLTTELVHWAMADGKIGSGILYKPEDFDSTKKYPVIFLYDEKRSDDLYEYQTPSLSSTEINIPYYVSRGYLVFEPDIYFEIGHPGRSVIKSVVSAAQSLSKRPYVDGGHMGIQGYSFGGFETNYLVAHTHLFAAAEEGAGASDIVSHYDGLMYGCNGDGSSSQFYYETGQGRIGATLWERPDLYIENSPIFGADSVTTPLLMMHNKKDSIIPFSQGVELFTGLRRLGKRVWMLQYDECGHEVTGEKNQRDYTFRMREFFDHYLKGMPAPVWMTEGIPARQKGIRSGYELDSSGREP